MLTVGRGRADAVNGVARAVEPAARRVLLAQRQRAGRDVEVVDALRLQHAAETETQHGRGRIEIGFAVVGEGRRGDADGRRPRHRDLARIRQAVGAHRRPAFVLEVGGNKGLECLEMSEMLSHLLGHDLAPVGGGRRRLARAHQPEVGRVEIGADEEFVADMVGLVDEAAPARLDDPEFPGRLIDGQVAEFAPSLGVEVEQDEFA